MKGFLSLTVRVGRYSEENKKRSTESRWYHAFTILLTRSTVLHSSLHITIFESSRSSVETVWLDIQYFKCTKSWNRTKYNVYIVFCAPEHVIVILQNTTFQNYVLPDITEEKPTLQSLQALALPYSGKKTHSENGNATVLPLSPPTGTACPFIP